MLYVDAPVMAYAASGERERTLTFMVGCQDKKDLERASIALSAMGNNIIHCGGPGSGNAAMLSNNLILGI